MAMVFNPTTESLTENLTLPLYYSGLTDAVEVSVGGAAATKVSFHSEGRTTLDDQAMHQVCFAAGKLLVLPIMYLDDKLRTNENNDTLSHTSRLT
jgi:hypothetical protein